MLLNSTTTIQNYKIRIGGVLLEQVFLDRNMAYQAIQNLPSEKRVLAEVVPVTNEGKQLLMESV